MATHAEIAARLLRGAADFFRTVGEQNADIKDALDENAETYEAVASLVENDPSGEMVFADDDEA